MFMFNKATIAALLMGAVALTGYSQVANALVAPAPQKPPVYKPYPRYQPQRPVYRQPIKRPRYHRPAVPRYYPYPLPRRAVPLPYYKKPVYPNYRY